MRSLRGNRRNGSGRFCTVKLPEKMLKNLTEAYETLKSKVVTMTLAGFPGQGKSTFINKLALAPHQFDDKRDWGEFPLPAGSGIHLALLICAFAKHRFWCQVAQLEQNALRNSISVWNRTFTPSFPSCEVSGPRIALCHAKCVPGNR